MATYRRTAERIGARKCGYGCGGVYLVDDVLLTNPRAHRDGLGLWKHGHGGRSDTARRHRLPVQTRTGRAHSEGFFCALPWHPPANAAAQAIQAPGQAPTDKDWLECLERVKGIEPSS